VAVPNGTIAIYLSLLASGLTKGKRVAVPNITMIATINAIIWAGADPVIVDVNERLCMSLTSLQKVEKLDGVIYVPLNGRTEEGLKIEKYCRDNEIVLIEDSAHALGSNYENKKCGSLADLSIFSFTPHKIITMGQGGMILTDNDELYDYLFNIKTFNRSKDKSDLHEGFGLNFKITDLQSALGLSQFKKLNQFIKIKQNISNLYTWFIDLVCKSKSQRDGLNKYLQEKNIITRDSYPALSSQFYLSNIEKVNLDYSEKISEKILWLPSSTNLTNTQIKNISEEINFFLNQN
jgi:perosamine synthetase